MNEILTDISLAFFLTKGNSLASWDSVGTLVREADYYNRLAGNFKRLYVFSYGNNDMARFQKIFVPNVIVVDKSSRLPNFIYQFILPFQHRRILQKCRILKTNQLYASIPAVITKLLFRKAKLMVRCGYIASLNARLYRYSLLKTIYTDLFEWLSFRLCDVALVSSAEGYGYVYRRYPFLKNKLHILPNAINTEIFKPLPSEIKYDIGYVGRLELDKNLISLLKAVQGSDLSVCFIGQGPERSVLQDYANKMEINLTIIDRVENHLLPKYYNAFRIFAFPSFHEGNPKTLLEAMSCSRPIISTDVIGVRSVVINNKNGLLVTPAPEDLARGITWLLSDLTLQDRLGRQARQYIIDHYDIKRCVELEIKTFAESAFGFYQRSFKQADKSRVQIGNRLEKMRDLVYNCIGRNPRLVYIVEAAAWSIRWDGYYLTRALRATNCVGAATRTTARCIRNRIIHFGSWGTYLANNKFSNLHSSNRVILTIFHDAGQITAKDAARINARVDYVHTSSNLTKKSLIHSGIDKDKIVVVPLGVDVSLFQPATPELKTAIRKDLDIPENIKVIGSFQKDGVGWGDGLEPKLIKGPDIFLAVVKQLAKQFPIHVLLTGPARGYVKTSLDRLKITYTHRYLKNYLDLVPYYQALDLYLVTSRVEGGPKALLEAGACSIPLVSTRVGMAPDLIRDGENGFLANVDDIEGLVSQCSVLFNQADLRGKIGKNTYNDVQVYSWPIIAGRYYTKMYNPLLTSKKHGDR